MYKIPRKKQTPEYWPGLLRINFEIEENQSRDSSVAKKWSSNLLLEDQGREVLEVVFFEVAE